MGGPFSAVSIPNLANKIKQILVFIFNIFKSYKIYYEIYKLLHRSTLPSQKINFGKQSSSNVFIDITVIFSK